jgi:erythromycin esterase-like protein
MELQNFRDLLESKVTPLPPITDPSFVSKFDDYGGCQVVVIGSSTHGAHECHEARAKITEHLITNYGFNIVAIEADWPDAESIDCHVRRRPGPLAMMEAAFDRFPRWLWRNHETEHFVEWLRERNEGLPKQKQIGFYGLDLYSLSKSMESVINTLTHTDPEMAKLARRRYDKVQPWIRHMEEGKTERIKAMIASTEAEVVSMLKDLLQKRLDERAQDKDTEEFHSSEQNARLVAGKHKHSHCLPPSTWPTAPHPQSLSNISFSLSNQTPSATTKP